MVATIGGSILGLLLALARLVNPEKAGRADLVHWLGFCVRFLLCMLRCSAVRHCLAQVIIWAFVIFPFFVHPTDGALISGESAINFRRSYGH